MTLRCAIIDDEFLAREYLKDYISKIPFLDLIGDYNSPLKIIDKLKSKSVDLVFLDINMPDISGIDFIKSLDRQPYIILTTAYAEFALEGYELNVVDYLLKPFSFERFLKAVNKAADLSELQRQTGAPIAETEAAETHLHEDYFVVRADRKYYKINYDDLIYIEGQKAYVTFYTKQQHITALISLKELEMSLPADRFVRIHKSYVVAIAKIQSFEGSSIEIARKHLPVGKNYKDRVQAIFHLKE